ncbi:MAG TPA: hypothetical protein VMK12_28525, partial [Anaeromyxobacteraceae bacterium]|nr:hypothetical protein [Anaeromyxobacteraceae bacterium]
KTSLVASWLQRRDFRHLWVQMDQGDGDVATFFHYLALGAARTIGTQPRLPTFTPEHLTAPGAFARRFFRVMSSGTRPPSVIVFDDYQEVRADSPVHAALREGLGEVPQGMLVVVTSRTEPPAEMARLRACGALEVLLEEDLALSHQEAGGVAALWGYSAGDQDLVLGLHERTAGCAAGLVLLLAGARPGGGAHLPGAEAAVFEYLAEEVLGPAEPDTQTVLLETALLPHVTEEVAVRLTGVERVGEILSALSRHGHFVVRRDAPELTFQYHALFQEFLLRRAKAVISRERLMELRLSGARLLEEAGEEEEAIGLYQEARAWADMIRVIGSRAPELLRQGRSEMVGRWVLAIPELVRAHEPWLLLWLGLARSIPDPSKAQGSLKQAFDLFWKRGDGAGAYLAWAAFTETCCYELDDVTPLDRWLPILAELRERFPQIPGPEVEARVVTAAFTGLMSRQPWHPALREWEERALSLALSCGDPRLRLMVGRPLALYYAWWGADLPKARILLKALRDLVVGNADNPGVAISWLIADANLQRRLGRPDACIETVDRALAMAAENGLRLWNPFLVSLRCWATMMKGDLDAAGQALEQMASQLEGATRLARCASHYAASILARWKGEHHAAREHGRLAVDLAIASGVPLAEARCRLEWALSQPPQSMQAETRLCLELARRCGSRLVVLESRLALAAAAMRDEQETHAVEHLREGFAIASQLNLLHSPALSPDELRAVP